MSQQYDAPFIAVEGPIGVGKTSLATMLAHYFNYKLLKEIVDENPFLSKFYENIAEWSFQTEMFFLCNRYKQLEDTYDNNLSRGKAVVSDYHIFKNLLFAKQTLKQDHFDKYDRIYRILTNDLPRPNIIIHLHASLPTLLNRIEQRGRLMEQAIDPKYLQQLSDDYHQFIKDHQRVYPDIPILSFNGDKLDFVNNKDDFNRIVDQVVELVKKQELLF
ncbi:deoxynucleoside kinase [Evansella cellulosilytica]|uniref:Deoxynucleoside kinase n=1 Tax=Evansella cellulosilytica (strain ATCC 21833 / DSM 2522 / FERM P-1141 / JCM 9156 / N-4) TaxID=649639 RepID=E6U085_EVAC2|nr:deoxynucleoside kinase [Evansella cellulosilytica]ADU30201.1 deoxynucleoside kinase [Evansella cellulosilytica DSM 2522]